MADELTTKRIINLPAESAPDSGDVLVVDNQSNGTKKLPVSYFENEINSKIAKPTESPNGENGQLLRTNGDGTTEWTDFATPTDEQVGGAVSEWLDDHPEATTTVNFSVVTKVYNNVAALVADTTLIAGNNVCTKGYYEEGDGGACIYVISDTAQGEFYISLNNAKYANMLEEGPVINVEQIGIKRYENKDDALADSLTMSKNNAIVKKALEASLSLRFGEGYYAFYDYIQMNRKSSIYGYKRESTTLLFPNGIGLNYNLNIEYDYLVVQELTIESYGNCINVDAIVYNVVNCRFNRLNLRSEMGECIVAPRNNNGYRGGNDTCVWSSVFSHINAQSITGAAFANIKGLGNWFYFINIVGATRKAFRNCSGTVQRLDTLAEHPEVCFYYDDIEDYDLRLLLIDVHFEACEQSFIYTEDSTASTMSLGVFSIDSGCTRPQMQNATIPYIKVGTLTYFYHYGKYQMLPSEALFDMTALGGAILHSRQLQRAVFENFKTNLGGTTGLKINAGGQLYTFYGDYTGFREGNPYEVRRVYESVGINRLYGGRSHQMLTITDSTLPSTTTNITIKNIDASYAFCDCINFKLSESTDNVTLRIIRTADSSPGKILVIKNDITSTRKLVFPIVTGNGDFAVHTDTQIELNPGETIKLFLDGWIQEGTTTYRLRWYPFTLMYTH